MNNVIAVRGATTIVQDTQEEIVAKTVELIKTIVEKNTIDGKNKKCVSILISTTSDIHAFYPARAIRESGLLDAPLFSCAEPDICGALPLCIRVMLTIECTKDNPKVHHVYLHDAANLRPDLVAKQ